MAKKSFEINANLDDVLLKLQKTQMLGTLVDEKAIVSTDAGEVWLFVFERYFLRTSNRGALIVTLDNINAATENTLNIHVVSTGTSEGFFFNIDWGASDQYIIDLCNELNVKY
ncbi:MAG: DUF6054 family protein [Bacilli bacterium]